MMPRRDRPLTRIERAVYRRLPAAQRAMRSAIFWARESFAIPILRAGLAKHTRALGLAHIPFRRIVVPLLLGNCIFLTTVGHVARRVLPVVT